MTSKTEPTAEEYAQALQIVGGHIEFLPPYLRDSTHATARPPVLDAEPPRLFQPGTSHCTTLVDGKLVTTEGHRL